jgi:hypothetical protein
MKILTYIIFLFFLISPVCYLQATPIPDDIPTPEPRPPIIPEHNPVVQVPEDVSIEISLKIQGARPEDIVNLNFRERGTSEFHVLPMGLNPETKQFEATIDERYHSRYVIEYYIEIFPVGVAPIRLPADPGSFYEIKTIRNIAKIIRAILIMFLIASPAIIAYIIGRMYKTHVKKTTVYQQKLSARKRTLARQREKHYQDYWRRMTGNRKADKGKGTIPAGPDPSSGSIPPKYSIPDEQKIEDEVDESAGNEEIFEEADELQRELDEILSKRHEISKSTAPAAKQSVPPQSSKQPASQPPKQPTAQPPKQPTAQPPKQPVAQSIKPPLPLKYPTRPASSGSQVKRTTAPLKPPLSSIPQRPNPNPGAKPAGTPSRPAQTGSPAQSPVHKSAPQPETRRKIPPATSPAPLDQITQDIDLEKSDSKKLDKNERDKLLDILGLDI